VGRENCGFGEEFSAQVQLAPARFGDFQANGALAQGKRSQIPPRQLAQRWLEAVRGEEMFSPTRYELQVAGGGFLNIALSGQAMVEWLAAHGDGDALRRSARELDGRTCVVDFSSPNSAKQMHVGHLRSLVLGDAICRILEFFGARVIRDNHIGDWGTQFGILLRQMAREGVTLEEMEPEEGLKLLEGLYRRGFREVEESEEALREAREELVALQGGDRARLALWERINAISLAAFQQIYDLCSVHFDLVRGESCYRDSLDRVFRELLDCAIAEEDGGALAVFHRDHGRFCTQPFLIRKSDGASNYASSDLATVLYRVERLGADAILYAVDARQQDHFQQLFLTVERWFARMGYRLPELRHISFGTICGEDGRAIRTRSGEPIPLRQLFSEAIARALAIVEKKNPGLDGESRRRIARAVGVGAIKYGDLCQNRTSDYAFSWDRMLSFDGNTAPYLLYALARLHAIARHAPRELSNEAGEAISPIRDGEERALARKLLHFPTTLHQVLADFRPHLLCTYLYELAGEFSSFYAACRVIGPDRDESRRRLFLCSRTRTFLQLGLELLGLETLEQM
jgi:arginyl-tRNA synthetase